MTIIEMREKRTKLLATIEICFIQVNVNSSLTLWGGWPTM